MAFGGQSWPISSADMNLGSVQGQQCLGGIFDLNLGSNVGSGGGNPNWVVGDTFLVSDAVHLFIYNWISILFQKNVYSVFRANPAAVGFAQLSDTAGGSSGACFTFESFIGRVDLTSIFPDILFSICIVNFGVITICIIIFFVTSSNNRLVLFHYGCHRCTLG